MVKNKKINTIEAKLNRTKPLEEIEEQIETLKRKIEEDRHIMNDKKSSTELKQAAAVRFSEKKKKQTIWPDWSNRVKKGKKRFLCVRGLKISSRNMAGPCKRLFWLPA